MAPLFQYNLLMAKVFLRHCGAFLRRISFNLPFFIPWHLLLNHCAFLCLWPQDLKTVNYERSQGLRRKPVAASEKSQNTVPIQKNMGRVSDDFFL